MPCRCGMIRSWRGRSPPDSARPPMRPDRPCGSSCRHQRHRRRPRVQIADQHLWTAGPISPSTSRTFAMRRPGRRCRRHGRCRPVGETHRDRHSVDLQTRVTMAFVEIVSGTADQRRRYRCATADEHLQIGQGRRPASAADSRPVRNGVAPAMWVQRCAVISPTAAARSHWRPSAPRWCPAAADTSKA